MRQKLQEIVLEAVKIFIRLVTTQSKKETLQT